MQTKSQRVHGATSDLVSKVINPKLKEAYPEENYTVQQSVGIDTSTLFVAKTGIRGSNDLVWVGRAANYAAKLSSLNQAGSGLLISSPYFWQTWKTPDTMRRILSLNINALREAIEENAIKMGSAIFHGIRRYVEMKILQFLSACNVST